VNRKEARPAGENPWSAARIPGNAEAQSRTVVATGSVAGCNRVHRPKSSAGIQRTFLVA